MRKRSNTRAANQRTRRGSSKIGRRQTILRAKTPRPTTRGRARSRSRKGVSTSAHITTNHQTIQHWTEARGGWPATVGRTARGGAAGILRIDFPGFGEGTLKPISWHDWFEKFDETNLAFLYQERTAEGEQSRFFKLIECE